MSSKNRTTFSWGLSIFVHTLLALAVIRAGLHFAIPEGTVSGESVSFDVIQKGEQLDTKTTEPAPPSEPMPPPPPQPAPAPKHKKAAVAKSKPKIAVIKIAKHTQKKAVVTEPQEEDVPKVEDVKEEEKNPEETEAEQPQEETPPVVAENEDHQETDQGINPEENPNPPVAEATPVQMPPPAPPVNAVPKFGSPGSMVDESKLVSLPGNRPPTYPWMARLRRQEGTVVLRAYIKPNGRVDIPLVERSSGYPLIDRAAVEAYANWRFQPGVSGWVEKPFHFNLTGK